jgi:hypothetical protein
VRISGGSSPGLLDNFKISVKKAVIIKVTAFFYCNSLHKLHCDKGLEKSLIEKQVSLNYESDTFYFYFDCLYFL